MAIEVTTLCGAAAGSTPEDAPPRASDGGGNGGETGGAPEHDSGEATLMDVGTRLRLAWLQIVLVPVDWLLRLVGPRYRWYVWFFRLMPPRLVSRVAQARAVRAAVRTHSRVPAYRAFLAEHGTTTADLTGASVPPMDKQDYITRYRIEDRCVDGTLPSLATTIDESSGSTGTPHNWIRSNEERHATHVFISHFARYCYGPGPWITINAFSMGAWATGVNMGVALQSRSVVKCTGPDIDKVFSTLEFLGPGYTYLVCGYPPFLKRLIDESRRRGFPLRNYRLQALLGGEGNSEGLRDYLLPYFHPVFSGYGATDLEIGIAGETPISLAIRRAARDDPELHRGLFGTDPRLPMVFQYNPLMHYIEVSPEGELVFTISRLSVLSPRIRYNIHDTGGVATYPDMMERLTRLGRDPSALVDANDPRPLRLPFVWLYGRKDSTISVMGANIYPEDVEQCLYADPELSAITRSFMLFSRDEDGITRPVFAFELNESISARVRQEIENRMVERLRRLNADYRQAYEEYPAAARPSFEFHLQGQGPFAADRSRIKQTRIITGERVR